MKDLTISFNHNAADIKEAILINGKPFISRENIPTEQEYFEAAIFVGKIMKGGSSVAHLVNEILKLNKNEEDLIHWIFYCGYELTYNSSSFRERITEELFTNPGTYSAYIEEVFHAASKAKKEREFVSIHEAYLFGIAVSIFTAAATICITNNYHQLRIDIEKIRSRPPEERAKRKLLEFLTPN